MISYSRVSTYTQCPKKYEFRYLQNLKTFFDCNPQNPLEIGTMLHEYVELGREKAVTNYLAKYPVVTDSLIDEVFKVCYLGESMKKVLPNGGKYELKINESGFIGFIDLVVKNQNGNYDLYDFKYSNNVENYLKSPQLSLYKFFYERQTGVTIENLYFAICPKCQLKRKDRESLYAFRKRIFEKLAILEPKIIKVEFEPLKVAEFLADANALNAHTGEYAKNQSRLCDWCEYQQCCEKGNKTMLLPENKRREQCIIKNPDMWIYADSYVGKSMFVDHFENVIFANTDGNVSNITSPYVRICDEYITEGRMTRKVLAWVKFKEFIAELAKKDNTFEIVALDLIEDLYEHCRFYVFDQLGIRHESDSGFGKGWDMVRTEFLGTIKQLKALGYRVIYISKESVKEITYANGVKVSTFSPNIQEKVANVLAGTVTLTLRAYMNERGRYLQLRKNENVFGGGRIDFKRDYCELDVNEFDKALIEAQDEKVIPARKNESAVLENTPIAEEPKQTEQAEEPKPVRKRTRKRVTKTETEQL